MQQQPLAPESSPEADDFKDASAESSPAVDTADPELAGDPVQALYDTVLSGETEETPEAEEPEGEEDAEKSDEPDKESEAKQDEKDDENLPFHKHPRFQQLLGEKNQYKQQVEDLQPKVQDYENIQAYLRENNLGAQDAAQALEVAALIQSDPGKAFEAMKPIFERVAREAGYLPPKELNERVQKGELTREQAMQLSRQEAERRNRESQLSRREQQLQQQEAMAQQQQVIQAANQVVQSWEQQVRQRDPDFDRKTDLLEARLTQLTSQNGPPRSAQEAQQRLDAAYEWANGKVQSVQPQRKATQPSPTRRPSKAMNHRPKDLNDIFNNIIGPPED